MKSKSNLFACVLVLLMMIPLTALHDAQATEQSENPEMVTLKSFIDAGFEIEILATGCYPYADSIIKYLGWEYHVQVITIRKDLMCDRSLPEKYKGFSFIIDHPNRAEVLINWVQRIGVNQRM